MKNYDQWKVHHHAWASIEGFVAGWGSSAGVHSIVMPEGYTLDILVNEHVATADPSQALLVFFGGAVTKRETRRGPFFSGVGISNGCKLPLVAISDPSVDCNERVNIAWYTGGARQNFQNNVTKLLRMMANATSRELLLSGGSGGGFAALHFASQLGDIASVFAWNPQTDIFEYSERFVKIYLREVFGFSHSILAQPGWKDYCRDRINQHVFSSVVSDLTLSRPRRVLYLQNFSDWHAKDHLRPMLANSSRQNLATEKGAHVLGAGKLVVVNEFAQGHAPPPTDLVKAILKQMIEPAVDPASINLQVNEPV